MHNKEKVKYTKDIVGIVLAGGLSTRMGKDKTQLRLHGTTGPTLIENSTKLLSTLLPSVWIACRAGQNRQGLCIYDMYENCGPCGALYTALHHAKTQGFKAILVLACDMPFMNTTTLQKLLVARPTHKQNSPQQNLLTTFLQKETKRIQALTAIYEITALPLFAKALQENQYKISHIIPETQRTVITYTKTENRPFTNCNNPEDWKKYTLLSNNSA